MGRRTLVIGDVHGCLDELDALLAEAAYDPGADDLCFVGDLVAKGPASEGVVRRVRELGARCVRGNHEERLLRAVRKAGSLQQAREAARSGSSLSEALEDLSEGSLSWLARLPLAHPLGPLGPGGADLLMVHGAYDGRPLGETDPEILQTGRTRTATGGISARIEGQPWAATYVGPPFVVFGHDALRGLQRHPDALGLDTGCVYGGRLSAALFFTDLPADAPVPVLSVRAKRTYRSTSTPLPRPENPTR